MSFNQPLDYSPSMPKACSRCRARKVKCDLKLPRCSACIKQHEQCNMEECVSYSYSVISKLQERIAFLQARLDSSSSVHGTDGADQRANMIPRVITPPAPPDQRALLDVQKEAEEVGILAIGGSVSFSENKYVGSAAGSTFVRIFLKQLNLDSAVRTRSQGGVLNQSFPEITAGLPTSSTANFLFKTFIDYVYVWWPFLPLASVRRTFQEIYCNPSQRNDYEKFLVFIILALASDHSLEREEYRKMLDLNTPLAYFQTALRFFAQLPTHSRDLSGLHAVLLLTLWMLNSATSAHTNDLWQLSRYAMSLAIEMGLHRHNSDWGFSAEELELRSRTWWSVYNLEKQVALVTGRVLSIRDHAIDAQLPSNCSLDELSRAEARAAPIFSSHNVLPFNFLIRLRRIGGHVLESIYIARGPNGKCPFYSFQQIGAMSEELHRDLEDWKRQLDEARLKPSREYSELKIEYCILLLLLNRPSPTFMIPSSEMLVVCSRASASALNQWLKISSDYGISAVCRCFRQLHAILLVGLAALYCDWRSNKMRPENSSSQSDSCFRHERDTAIALDLITRGVDFIKGDNLLQYVDLFKAMRHKVYSSFDRPLGPVGGPTDINPFPAPGDYMDTNPETTDDNVEPFLFLDGQDFESYINQVTGYLADGTTEMDDVLTAWYGSILRESETQPQTSSFPG